jgi:hypothetical protein
VGSKGLTVGAECGSWLLWTAQLCSGHCIVLYIYSCKLVLYQCNGSAFWGHRCCCCQNAEASEHELAVHNFNLRRPAPRMGCAKVPSMRGRFLVNPAAEGPCT